MTHLTTEQLDGLEIRRQLSDSEGGSITLVENDKLKSLIHAAREVEKVKCERCEHCHSDKIYHGPPDCPGCGAPNCCQTCCRTTQLESDIDLLTRKLQEKEMENDALKKELELFKNEKGAH